MSRDATGFPELFAQRPAEFRLATGPLTVMMLALLLTVSVRGPNFFWLRFWLSDVFRLGLFAGVVLLALSHIYVTVHLAKAQTLRVVGTVLAAAGAGLGGFGCIYWLGNFEYLLSTVNDELLLLPGMISRILGVTTHLNIPIKTPIFVAAVGGVLLVTGCVLIAAGVRRHVR